MSILPIPEGEVPRWPHAIIAALCAIPVAQVPSMLARADERRGQRQLLSVPSPDEIAHWAEGYRGAANQYRDGDFPADEADWRVDEAYPIERLISLMDGGLLDWIDWFRAECEDAIGDGREGYGHLLVEDIEEEVFIVELPDGRVDVWDGWHRIAAAIIKNEPIPAFIGVPRPGPIPGMGV